MGFKPEAVTDTDSDEWSEKEPVKTKPELWIHNKLKDAETPCTELIAASLSNTRYISSLTTMFPCNKPRYSH